MTTIYVVYDTHVDEDYRSDEEWGDWRRSQTSSVVSANLSKPDRYYGYEKFNVCFNADAGQDVYALVLTYGTGDSFGHSSGNMEILWVFQQEILAEKALEWFNEKSENYTIEFFQEDLNKIQISNPASGYFECVENIEIVKLTLQP